MIKFICLPSPSMSKQNGIIKGAIKVLKALSGTDQRMILDHLTKHGKSTPSTMSKRFKKSEQRICFNLKGMVDTGIVSRRIEGRNAYYTANSEMIRKINSLAEAIVNNH